MLVRRCFLFKLTIDEILQAFEHAIPSSSYMLSYHKFPSIDFCISEEVGDVERDRALVLQLIMHHSFSLELLKVLLDSLLHHSFDLGCRKFEEEHLPIF